MSTMVHHASHILPPLPHFSLSTIAPSNSFSATMSESSTRLSDLSSRQTMHRGFHPFRPDLTSGAVGDQYSRAVLELLPLGPLSDNPGYIPILPRTRSASELFEKRCETCNAAHDGSFGAGRFCSSRCARTVGGLAHRKKRMLERGTKARHAAESRANAKKVRAISKIRSDCSLQDRIVFPNSIVETLPSMSARSIMDIGALLNPTD